MVGRDKNKISVKSIDYKSAGVDIDAATEAVDRIKHKVETTFTDAVLAGVGSFGGMVNLKSLIKDYRYPVLVQSIDGVGTKMIVARMMNRYDTIGIDLLSATCNDIVVHGAKPLTFLDYISNDKLIPEIVETIVSGVVSACQAVGVALVGGETAEMPDTYLPGEHELVGVITGVVEKDRIISGEAIQPGDVILGLGSSGLHTNGYSLARKLFFESGQLNPDSTHPDLENTVGETLLAPHINYTKPVLGLLEMDIPVKGMAHITGGGFLDNIPRILPDGCGVEIHTDSWPVLPVFRVMQQLGKLDTQEMYRTFNMGIGLVMILASNAANKTELFLQQFRNVSAYEIGNVVKGDGKVTFA